MAAALKIVHREPDLDEMSEAECWDAVIDMSHAEGYENGQRAALRGFLKWFDAYASGLVRPSIAKGVIRSEVLRRLAALYPPVLSREGEREP